MTATVAATGLVVALLVSLCYAPNRTLVFLNIFYAIVTIAFICVEWFVFTPILAYVTLLFGVFFGTYAIFDIFDHLVVRSNPQSDAYAAYEESGGCCYPRCVGVTWLITAILFQLVGIWLALILMSDECEDDGWFECVFHSKFDLDLLEFDWWPDDWDLFDNH